MAKQTVEPIPTAFSSPVTFVYLLGTPPQPIVNLHAKTGIAKAMAKAKAAGVDPEKLSRTDVSQPRPSKVTPTAYSILVTLHFEK